MIAHDVVVRVVVGGSVNTAAKNAMNPATVKYKALIVKDRKIFMIGLTFRLRGGGTPSQRAKRTI
jgi:hypothetical protein